MSIIMHDRTWYVINLITGYRCNNCEKDKLTFVVFNKANPSIPEVSLSAPDFFTITSVVCFSDPSLKPSIEKTNGTFNSKHIVIWLFIFLQREKDEKKT